MNKDLPIGTRVLLDREFAKDYFDGSPRSNPINCGGTITEQVHHFTRVEWDNGFKNSYDDDDSCLIPIEDYVAKLRHQEYINKTLAEADIRDKEYFLARAQHAEWLRLFGEGVVLGVALLALLDTHVQPVMYGFVGLQLIRLFLGWMNIESLKEGSAVLVVLEDGKREDK